MNREAVLIALRGIQTAYVAFWEAMPRAFRPPTVRAAARRD
jgi:hypothetical protein